MFSTNSLIFCNAKFIFARFHTQCYFFKRIPRPCSASRREKTCAMHARLCAICGRTDRVRCTYRIYLLTSKKQFYILFIPFISVFIFPQFYSYFPKIYLQYHRFKGYYIFIFVNMQQVKNASIVLSFLLVSLSAYNSPPFEVAGPEAF